MNCEMYGRVWWYKVECCVDIQWAVRRGRTEVGQVRETPENVLDNRGFFNRRASQLLF